MLDVRVGGFEMAENLLHKHINGILSVVQVIRNNDHALTFQCVMLDPSMSYEKSSLAIANARIGFTLASYGSILRKIYLQNYTLHHISELVI